MFGPYGAVNDTLNRAIMAAADPACDPDPELKNRRQPGPCLLDQLTMAMLRAQVQSLKRARRSLARGTELLPHAYVFSDDIQRRGAVEAGCGVAILRPASRPCRPP